MARWWLDAAKVVASGAVRTVRDRWLGGPVPTSIPVHGDAPEWDGRGELKLLVWNVQFGAGRTREFFYDGGDAVRADLDAMSRVLDEIASVLDAEDPDAVLWQELDRRAARTGRVDQLHALHARHPATCWVSTPYHRAAHVPWPPGEHLGRVDMHLAITSRYRLRLALRHPLPPLRQSWLRRQFSPRRAVLRAELGPLVLMNAHLSAFHYGDGTLPLQVAELERLAEHHERQRAPWVLAGDMNALPPDDDPSRLGEDARLYPDDPPPLRGLFSRYGVPGEIEPTYLPFGAERADWAIDHVFAGSRVEVIERTVLSEHAQLSDHLPIRVRLRLRR